MGILCVWNVFHSAANLSGLPLGQRGHCFESVSLVSAAGSETMTLPARLFAAERPELWCLHWLSASSCRLTPGSHHLQTPGRQATCVSCTAVRAIMESHWPARWNEQGRHQIISCKDDTASPERIMIIQKFRWGAKHPWIINKSILLFFMSDIYMQRFLLRPHWQVTLFLLMLILFTQRWAFGDQDLGLYHLPPTASTLVLDPLLLAAHKSQLEHLNINKATGTAPAKSEIRL